MSEEVFKSLGELAAVRKRLESLLKDGKKIIRAETGKLDGILFRAEATIKSLVDRLKKSESNMGRAADAINQLQGTISTQASTISSLQSQIATLQAQPTEDPADVAAINAVLGAPTPAAVNNSGGAVDLSNTNTPSGGTPVANS